MTVNLFLLNSESYYPADELKAIRERKAIEAERAEKRRLAFEKRFAELNARRQQQQQTYDN